MSGEKEWSPDDRADRGGELGQAFIGGGGNQFEALRCLSLQAISRVQVEDKKTKLHKRIDQTSGSLVVPKGKGYLMGKKSYYILKPAKGPCFCLI